MTWGGVIYKSSVFLDLQIVVEGICQYSKYDSSNYIYICIQYNQSSCESRYTIPNVINSELNELSVLQLNMISFARVLYYTVFNFLLNYMQYSFIHNIYTIYLVFKNNNLSSSICISKCIVKHKFTLNNTLF